MSKNPHKTISVNNKGMIISFTDSNKHFFVKFEKPIHQDTPKYQEFDEPMFSQKQQRMYYEALYGLSIYPESVIRKMPKTVVNKIATRNKMVQKVINRLKQEIVNQKVNSLLNSLFPKSPIVKQFISVDYHDAVRCPISSRDLKITDLMIAERLVSLQLLPVNFFNL